jgi:hypothetical protein
MMSKHDAYRLYTALASTCASRSLQPGHSAVADASGRRTRIRARARGAPASTPHASSTQRVKRKRVARGGISTRARRLARAHRVDRSRVRVSVMVEPDAPRDASAAVDRGGGLPAGVSDQPAVSIGSVEYLRHRLTAEEAEHFATQGWLLIENALPAEQHWLLQELVTGMHDAKMAKGRLPHETIVQAAFSPANSLQDHEATMHLLKNERVLPKVVDILGANIKCYHSHWNYTPGRNEPEPDYSDLPTLGFHQDSHRVNVEMGHEQPGGPRARLSLKCAYFLTDCSCSGRANTWVVPGSHLLDTLPSVPGGRGQPPGAVPVLAPANSCLVFVSWACNCVFLTKARPYLFACTLFHT